MQIFGKISNFVRILILVAMKRFFLNLMLLGIISLVFASCNKEVIENPVEEGDVFIVQLGWGGELDVDYEPLTRAAADDLYGVQIYSAPDIELEEGATPTWTPYAHGLFDGSAGISAKLQKGYKYRFVASMVRDGKNKISEDATGFSYPFNMPEGDEFTFDSESEMDCLGAGATSLKPDGAMYQVPNTDRYYGELDNFVPSKENTNANIRMKRTSFGAKFIAEGQLATSGTLQVQIAGAPEMELALTSGDDYTNDIFTFTDVLAAYNDNIYKQELNVNLNWLRADGTVFPMGNHLITYKRNASTVVTVTIDNDGTDSGISFEIDDSETGEMPEADDLNVNIKDGEVVEEEAPEAPDFIVDGENKGKGIIIDNLVWAPVNSGDYEGYLVPSTLCPEGWRLPTMNEFMSLSANRSTFNGGYYFSGSVTYSESSPKVWFAAKGREYLPDDGDNTIMYYVGEQGFYWSSDKTGGSGVRVLKFTSTGVSYEDLSYYNYYCSVRCVTEIPD